MFTIIADATLDDLKKYDAILLAKLYSFYRANLVIKSKNEWLAENTRVDKKTVIRSIKTLESKDYIKVERKANSREIKLTTKTTEMYDPIFKNANGSHVKKNKKSQVEDTNVPWFDKYLKDFEKEHGN